MAGRYCPEFASKLREINTTYETSDDLRRSARSGKRGNDGQVEDSDHTLDSKYFLPIAMKDKHHAAPIPGLSSMVQGSSQFSQYLANEELFSADPLIDLDNAYGLDKNRVSINNAVDRFIHTSDWDFLRRKQESSSDLFGTSVPTHCPSLSSGVSSRNSSTRSNASIRWQGSERALERFRQDMNTREQQCHLPDCYVWSKDLKAHMLTHEDERPWKCPIETCEYHVRGFARAYDNMRHTNTHFKGILVCGFCPGTISAAEKTFNRQYVFSRHLLSVHGAKEISSSRREALYNIDSIKHVRKSAAGRQIATCTLCTEPFDVQCFFEHLPGCVLRQVMRDPGDTCDEESDLILDFEEAIGGVRDNSVVTPKQTIENMTQALLPSAHLQRQLSYRVTSAPETITVSSLHRNRPGADITRRDSEIEQLTTSSRCLSLTSSKFVNSSDEETDCTEDESSPESEVDPVRVRPMLLSVKQQLIDTIMTEFHHIFGHQPENLRTHGENSSSPNTYAEHSSNTSSPYVSRKRSLSGGGSTPPNGDRNSDDDPHKRRKPDPKVYGKDATSDLRFACPFYKRNPGRHQTFTSCRDPGFITVARLKEHLYRRHLLPIQCHRCCSTFANEPTLREHQRDPQGCEIKEQAPLEGFDKEQERKLKSKKRSLVYQSEEDKWKVVYHILFPDDNDADMPSPYIEYQPSGSTSICHSSNITRFQDFSRLELPRLVRRTLEVVVEEEAQPLEEKLKERLVDIVKQCQDQLITMFRGVGGTLDPPANSTAATQLSQDRLNTAAGPPFQSFDSSPASHSTAGPSHLPMVEAKYVMTDPITLESINAGKPSGGSTASGSPDSGYDSTWTNAAVAQDASFDIPLTGGNEHLDREGYYGLFQDQSGYDFSTWSFFDPPLYLDPSFNDLPYEETQENKS